MAVIEVYPSVAYEELGVIVQHSIFINMFLHSSETEEHKLLTAKCRQCKPTHSIALQFSLHVPPTHFLGFKLCEPNRTSKAVYHIYKHGIKKSPCAMQTETFSSRYKLFLLRIPTVTFS